ncbi:unnamed protein product [Leuciscus chuanchicus]
MHCTNKSRSYSPALITTPQMPHLELRLISWAGLRPPSEALIEPFRSNRSESLPVLVVAGRPRSCRCVGSPFVGPRGFCSRVPAPFEAPVEPPDRVQRAPSLPLESLVGSQSSRESEMPQPKKRRQSPSTSTEELSFGCKLAKEKELPSKSGKE